MKATLEFNLDDEQEDFDAARQGQNLLCALAVFDNKLRDVVKYGERAETDKAIYAEIRSILSDTLNEYDIKGF